MFILPAISPDRKAQIDCDSSVAGLATGFANAGSIDARQFRDMAYEHYHCFWARSRRSTAPLDRLLDLTVRHRVHAAGADCGAGADGLSVGALALIPVFAWLWWRDAVRYSRCHRQRGWCCDQACAASGKAAVIPRGITFVTYLPKKQVCLACGATEDRPSPECRACVRRTRRVRPRPSDAEASRADSRCALDDQRVDDLDRICRFGYSGFATLR